MSVLSLVPACWALWKCWVCGARHRALMDRCDFETVPRDMQD